MEGINLFRIRRSKITISLSSFRTQKITSTGVSYSLCWCFSNCILRNSYHVLCYWTLKWPKFIALAAVQGNSLNSLRLYPSDLPRYLMTAAIWRINYTKIILNWLPVFEALWRKVLPECIVCTNMSKRVLLLSRPWTSAIVSTNLNLIITICAKNQLSMRKFNNPHLTILFRYSFWLRLPFEVDRLYIYLGCFWFDQTNILGYNVAFTYVLRI